MMKYPKDLASLIAYLKKLPGVGQKTAERFAFTLLDWEEQSLIQMATSLESLKARIPNCSECGCLMDEMTCKFCSSESRDISCMCVIASPRDVYAIEQTGNFNGIYHVLGTLLSPLDGKTSDNLEVPKLKERIEKLQVREMVLALDSTIEGDATSLFLKEELKNFDVAVSRLAFGLPVGSALDFVDEGTLAQAFAGRQVVQ